MRGGGGRGGAVVVGLWFVFLLLLRGLGVLFFGGGGGLLLVWGCFSVIVIVAALTYLTASVHHLKFCSPHIMAISIDPWCIKDKQSFAALHGSEGFCQSQFKTINRLLMDDGIVPVVPHNYCLWEV